ncbi:MAG: cation transport regulator ChaB [Desulfovibrionales bacterium]|nr:MAG: cation transport regulator ChaB [Desulfovibrionales bacterium]
MPYDSRNDLPSQVQENLPEHAQTIYRKAFNNAWEQYDAPEKRRKGADREETAHRVAWAAVKKVYVKDDQGEWVPRNE